ncbi:hypothetical protein GTGU_02642 [Trabulsiella guamensis ATCC 49490]|uniref:Uncharacterized protein n=1 Tax=Trabulsiella guamensis ATCC 49490 TaxID=1005994 RepID=A0A085A801_9ENTR|nr:hypothetical protein GTGU_02642 [Trabulsiella guamensis ATCC 49490]
MAELIYMATTHLIVNPLSLSPSLVLHILEEDLYDIDMKPNQFAETDLQLTGWFAEYRERRLKSPSEFSDLPELRWSDLPNGLFGLFQKN